MDQIEIGLWVTAGLLVMVIMGMRVAFAAALAGVVGLVLIFWAKKDFDPEKFGWALTVAVKQAGQVPHSKVASHELSLIPTFILIGYLAYYAGLTRSLFAAAKRWIAWVPGGLAVSTVFATAGFAAVSGASVATAAVFARIAIPEMLKIGYNFKCPQKMFKKLVAFCMFLTFKGSILRFFMFVFFFSLFLIVFQATL